MSTEWQGWANAAQRPPEGAWLTWLFLGGRGAGKTRAGAEWIGGLANGTKVQLALVGLTLTSTSPAPLRLAILMLTLRAYERGEVEMAIAPVEAWLAPYRVVRL